VLQLISPSYTHVHGNAVDVFIHHLLVYSLPFTGSAFLPVNGFPNETS